MSRFILATYKIENGFTRDFKVIDFSHNKSRLQYLANSDRFTELLKQGYSVVIYKELLKL